MVFAGNTNHVNSADSVNQANQQNLSVSNDSSNKASDSQTQISSAEAKKIAQKYIEEPGATAGTPKLSKIDGEYVYIVPVIENGKNVGEIDIDAATGKNVGGAGGAP
ncbi:MAG TPA: PepSY domain-containing protein [Methanobacterium sp.]|nr:PepSY domain-containing protein [Methanobacterium sp.]